MKLPLIALLFVLSASALNLTCYQKNATTDYSCSNNIVGAYDAAGLFVNWFYCSDDSYSTFGYGGVDGHTFNVNYTKPTDFSGWGIWAIAGYNGEYQENNATNFTIPAGCLDETVLQVRTYVSSGQNIPGCWNGSRWIGLGNFPGAGNRIYDEAFYWISNASSASYSAIVLETKPAVFWVNDSTATSYVLEYNSTNYTMTKDGSNWSKTIYTQLIGTNDSTKSFSFIRNGNQYTDSGTQHIHQAYYYLTSNLNESVFFDSDYWKSNLTIQNLSSTAILTQQTFSYYNTTVMSYSNPIQTNYENQITMQQTGYVVPNLKNSETRQVFPNITLTYEGSSRTIAPPANLTYTNYKMVVTACGDGNTTTVNASAIDTTTDTLLSSVNITAVVDLWRTGDYVVRSTFNFYNVSRATLCIYPAIGNYSMNTTWSYSKSNYLSGSVITYGTYDNVTENVTLPMVNISLGQLTVLRILSSQNVILPEALVKIYLDDIVTGNHTLIQSSFADSDGKVIAYLVPNSLQYSFEIGYAGLNYTVPSIILTCTTASCPPYDLELRAAFSEVSEYYKTLDKVLASCSVNATDWLICSVNDSSGLVKTIQLVVDKRNVLNLTQICNQNCTSSQCILRCNLGNTTNAIYQYAVRFYASPKQIVLSGILDYLNRLINWGSMGVFLAFLLLLTLYFAGSWNPTVAMLIAYIGLIFSYLIGLLPISIEPLIGLGFVIAVIVWKMGI